VLGDLNDYPNSPPLAALRSVGLADLTGLVEKPERYTLVYRGISQVIDYILISPSNAFGFLAAPYHINADFPVILAETGSTVYRSSDHDPIRVDIIGYSQFAYIPMVLNGE
jgi:predicted extracellular nuclease